ncbi:hypothetical protein LJC61_01800, partial [Ruminococcaceae bacterium OttesenSCG-928-A16]|nr:hypothetical protein [Ruminococcaceae bacterium OttesenSCG-928-A16]
MSALGPATGTVPPLTVVSELPLLGLLFACGVSLCAPPELLGTEDGGAVSMLMVPFVAELAAAEELLAGGT